jgi:hypothetical protein
LEGYDELMAKVVARFPPEKLMAAVAPEKRLDGLLLLQKVLALPDVLLAALTPQFQGTLPEDIQAEVRRRLTRH